MTPADPLNLSAPPGEHPDRPGVGQASSGQPGAQGAQGAGRAQAVYAQVLDGITIWLAVSGHEPGSTLALKDAATGRVQQLQPDRVDPGGSPGEEPLLTVRSDLSQVDFSDRDVVRSIVVTVAATGQTQPVLAGTATATTGLFRAPVAPGGLLQFALRSDRAGRLVLRRRVLAPGADLVSVTLEAGICTIRCRPHHAAPPVLSLVASDGEVLHRIPARYDGDVLTAELTAPLELPEGEQVDVCAGDDTDLMALRRPVSDLSRPGPAVALPTLVADQQPGVRLRWSPRAALQVVRTQIATDDQDDEVDGQDVDVDRDDGDEPGGDDE